jgi:hypothetical protein
LAIDLDIGCFIFILALDAFYKPVTKHTASENGVEILMGDSIEGLQKV